MSSLTSTCLQIFKKKKHKNTSQCLRKKMSSQSLKLLRNEDTSSKLASLPPAANPEKRRNSKDADITPHNTPPKQARMFLLWFYVSPRGWFLRTKDATTLISER